MLRVPVRRTQGLCLQQHRLQGCGQVFRP